MRGNGDGGMGSLMRSQSHWQGSSSPVSEGGLFKTPETETPASGARETGRETEAERQEKEWRDTVIGILAGVAVSIPIWTIAFAIWLIATRG